MINEIGFNGLTCSPSDYDCSDGELATCYNLIPEDNALKPVHAPAVVGNIKLQNKQVIEYCHKGNVNGDVYKHYIIHDKSGSGNGTWWWCDVDGDTPEEIVLDSFKVSTVCAMGNILCFIGESGTYYALWKDNTYRTFKKKDFLFKTEIRKSPKSSESASTFVAKYTKDEFLAMYDSHKFGSTNIYNFGTLKKSSLEKILGDIDAAVNKRLADDESLFKYTTFGVCLLRLYDGTYVATSGFFVLQSTLQQTLTINNTTPNWDGPSCEMYMTLRKFQLCVSLATDKIKDLITGFDVYLNLSDSLLDITEYNNGDYDTDTKIPNASYNLLFIKLKRLYEKVDEMPLYKVASFDMDDIGKFVDLKRPIGTEESFNSEMLNALDIGAPGGYLYNNRLHLFNYKKTFPYKDYPFVQYDVAEEAEEADFIAVHSFADGNKIYCKFKDKAVIPAMVSLCLPNLEFTDFYYKHGDDYSRNRIYYHNSKTYPWSICALYDKGIFGEHPAFWATNQKDYEEQLALAEKSDMVVSSSQSSILVSKAENPMVFPAKNSVSVGSSTIRALAANTQPISEGQFGDAPLYAFTDEGVWMLMLDSEGVYQSRQPVNREICTNTSGILQTDDAILYASDRGIIMQQGRSSKCITEALDDYPFDYNTMPHSAEILATGKIPSIGVAYRMTIRQYLKEAEMVFDYYNSRLVLFNPNCKYAYIYSLRSGMWGAIPNKFRSRVNIYPQAYAVNTDGRIVDLYNPDAEEYVPYFFCTRPMTLDAANIHKTIFSLIVRGYFQPDVKKCGIALYASNNLFDWVLVSTSATQYLRGIAGTPYKYFRIACIGNLRPEESISGCSIDVQPRWNNKLR
jgi:hypothetical protein